MMRESQFVAHILLFIYWHNSQADGDSCCVERLFGKTEITYLPMCEHPGIIQDDSVHSFEADLGREDYLNRWRNCVDRSC